MTTASDIMGMASRELHGFGSLTDQVTSLTNALGPTDTTFVVDFTTGQAAGITPGVVEIDDEQLYVIAIDQTTNTCTVSNGFGRGYSNTTATSHAPGALITSSPRFPRQDLFNKMNQIIGQVYPQLYAINTYETVVSYPLNEYTLPKRPLDILDVMWQDPIGNWHKVFGYAIDMYDGTFRLGSGAMIGRPLRITYSTEPTQFTSVTDDFTTTGLPASAIDVLVLGTCAYMTPSLDVSRAQTDSVEQSDRNKVVAQSAGVNAGKYYMAEFQQRLANEAQSLRRKYPPRIRRTF